MSQTKTTALNYNAILKKAKAGEFKLPAFQRRWKWSTRQVMSLYESLRLGYPIGSFLFLTSPEGEKLSPRSFHGSGKRASSNPVNESLVLDGQQRITAGLAIYYGLDEVEGSEYYIDCARVDALATEAKLNLDDEVSVEKFCENLDLENGYLVAKQRRADRKYHFTKSRLLWTAYLTEERQADLEEITDGLVDDKRLLNLIRKVIRRHLKPNTQIQVPIIELGNEFDLAAISKVFSTINSSGKMLTPFELVVAILYPSGITLEDDVKEFKQRFRYYANMDKNGEILLQVVALLSGKSPKKADLPKNVDAASYRNHAVEAATILNAAGEFLTKSLGVGLDVTDKLTPYDAIFAPLSIVLRDLGKKSLGSEAEASAKQKLRRWFVAAAISQRYQEGVHNKQERDIEEISAWLSGGAVPSWIENSRVTPNLMTASTTGAIGRLVHCLINSQQPKDPVHNSLIGFSDGALATQIHHIFPTRWVPKGIADYSKDAMDTNVVLNTMLLGTKTNSDWLNFDPKNQVEQSAKVIGGASRASFGAQFIDELALDVLKQPEKLVADYKNFLDLRYKAVVQKIKEFGILESTQADENIELDEPSISDL